jgi:hypothetical protein
MISRTRHKSEIRHVHRTSLPIRRPQKTSPCRPFLLVQEERSAAPSTVHFSPTSGGPKPSNGPGFPRSNVATHGKLLETIAAEPHLSATHWFRISPGSQNQGPGDPHPAAPGGPGRLKNQQPWPQEPYSPPPFIYIAPSDPLAASHF